MQKEIFEDYGWEDSEATPSHNYLQPAVERILNSKLKPGSRVLDLGCGNGYSAIRFHKIGFEVIGLDSSSTGIDIAKNHSGGAIDFRQYDINEPIPAGLQHNVDAVVSVEVIEHLMYPERLIASANKILKPGGVFLVTTPYHGYIKNFALSLAGAWDSHFDVFWNGGHVKFFSRKSLEKMIAAGGFRNTDFEGVGRFPYVWKSMIVTSVKQR